MENPVAIEVRNLSKKYRIGLKEEMHNSLREAIIDFFASPLKRYKRLRGLSDFGEGEADDIIWALKDVSFTLHHGDVLGIVGKNGAGKSTLLKVLSRVTDPSEGSISINGRVASLLEVGTGFHPELTGRENVFLNGTVLGMKKHEIERKFDEIVAFSGVEKFIDTPIKRYSSGMTVRLAFAVAANLEPDILIVDEVLAVGDAEFQKKCIGKMQDVAGQGRTVLFVSHNIQAVQGLCTKGILLQKGRLTKSGTIEEVINEYLYNVKETQLSTVWEIEQAPGNESAKIVQVEIRPHYLNGSDVIDLRTPFDITFSVNVLVPDTHIKVAYILNTLTGTQVFNIGSDRRKLGVGVHHFTCHVPAHLLNDGLHNLEIYFAVNDRLAWNGKDLLTFEVQELERTGDFYGKIPGAVRPILPWSYQ